MSETGDTESERPAKKAVTAYRTIGEVADELDLPTHVLRFWESKIPQLEPLKRSGGWRYIGRRTLFWCGVSSNAFTRRVTRSVAFKDC